MFALGPSSRRIVTAAALFALVGAVATMPLEVRSAAGEVVAAAPRVLPRPAPTAFVAVAPRRDPFVGGTAAAPRSAAAAGPAVAAKLPPMPVLPALPVVPAIIAAPRVTAIVTGARPSALVEEGGLARVVAVGDVLSGDRIVAIDTDGVHLARGTMLTVAPTAASHAGVR